MERFDELDEKFRVFVDTALEFPRVVKDATFTSPDDDWSAVMILNVEHQDKPIVVEFDSAYMQNEVTLDELAERMRNMILMTQAVSVAIVLSAWMVSLTDEDLQGDEEIPPPSEHENRVEKLIVQVMDASHYEAYSAPILRDDEQPPGLGEWERLDDGNPMHMAGRFVEELMGAFGHGHI